MRAEADEARLKEAEERISLAKQELDAASQALHRLQAKRAEAYNALQDKITVRDEAVVAPLNLRVQALPTSAGAGSLTPDAAAPAAAPVQITQKLQLQQHQQQQDAKEAAALLQQLARTVTKSSKRTFQTCPMLLRRRRSRCLPRRKCTTGLGCHRLATHNCALLPGKWARRLRQRTT